MVQKTIKKTWKLVQVMIQCTYHILGVIYGTNCIAKIDRLEW